MVDATKYAEGDYATRDLFLQAADKRFVVLSVHEGDTKFGKRLKAKISLDGREKEWTLSQKIVANLIVMYGKDTQAWVNKVVSYTMTKDDMILVAAGSTDAPVESVHRA